MVLMQFDYVITTHSAIILGVGLNDMLHRLNRVGCRGWQTDRGGGGGYGQRCHMIRIFYHSALVYLHTV